MIIIKLMKKYDSMDLNELRDIAKILHIQKNYKRRDFIYNAIVKELENQKFVKKEENDVYIYSNNSLSPQLPLPTLSQLPLTLSSQLSLNKSTSSINQEKIKQMSDEDLYLFKMLITNEINLRENKKENENIINEINENNFAISENDFEIENYKKNNITFNVNIRCDTRSKYDLDDHACINGFVEDDIKNIFFGVFDKFGEPKDFEERTSEWEYGDWDDPINAIGYSKYYIYSKIKYNYNKYNLFFDTDNDEFFIIEKDNDIIILYGYKNYEYEYNEANNTFEKNDDDNISFTFGMGGSLVKMNFKRKEILSKQEFVEYDLIVYLV